MSEVKVWLEEEHCHGLIAEVDKHAIRHKLVIILIRGLLEVDDWGKHFNWLFGCDRLRLGSSSLDVGITSGGIRELGLELWPDQESRWHA